MGKLQDGKNGSQWRLLWGLEAAVQKWGVLCDWVGSYLAFSDPNWKHWAKIRVAVSFESSPGHLGQSCGLVSGLWRESSLASCLMC